MSDSAIQSACGDSFSRQKWWVGFVLLGIVILGLSVRLYGIYSESIWWDEFTSVMHLAPVAEWEQNAEYARWNQTVIRQTAPSLLAFLAANRTLDPATMPLYYVLEYTWHKLVGRDAGTLRLLSVLFGIVTIPILFLFARELFGPVAGLIAAFCFALSPIHRQFAQEIRMYAPMTLLALLSAYTFMRLHRERTKRWWALHGAANLLLFWTHPFALLLPFTEGLSWLLLRLGSLRGLANWAVMNLLLFVPTGVYMASIRFWSSDTTSSWLRLPQPLEFLGDLFADDCVGLTWQLAPLHMIWEPMKATWRLVVSDRIAEIIVMPAILIGVLMAGAFILAAGYLLIASGARGRGLAGLRWPAFLLLWWLLPALALYVLSAYWRPCMMPRYTVHSSLALYLILGGAVALIPGAWMRRPAITLLCAAFAYQQMLVFEGPRHPDWRGAAQAIISEDTDDVILVHNWLWKRVFAFNLGPTPNLISYGDDFDSLAEEAAFLLETRPLARLSPDRERDVWVVIKNDYFQTAPCTTLETELSRRGIEFARTDFGGIEPILLYRLYRGPGFKTGIDLGLEIDERTPRELGDLGLEFWREGEYDYCMQACQYALRINPSYARAYSYLGMALKEEGDIESAVEKFEKAVELGPNDYPWDWANLGDLLTRLGRYDDALSVLKEAERQLPADASVYTYVGQAEMGKGNIEAAVAAFNKAITFDPGDRRPRAGLDEAQRRLDEARQSGVEPVQ